MSLIMMYKRNLTKSAKELSDFKENFDQWNNIYAKSHKVSIEEAIADSERD